MTGNKITNRITMDYLESQVGSSHIIAKPTEITNYILMEILKQLIELNKNE